MARQSVSNQSTAGQSSIMDDIGGVFSKLWHGITSIFLSIFGSDKPKSTASSAMPSDDPQDDDTQPRSRQTTGRGQRHGRRQVFSLAAGNNTGRSMYPGANDMSFASATAGNYFPQVDRVSSRFNGNSFGRESFSPAFASHGGAGLPG